MEVGLKYVLVIPSSLTLAGFAKFSAPTSFDTEYNLQPLVEPCCLRVEQAFLQWHGSDSYTSKGYKNEITKAKYPIDSRNYRLLVFILRLPRYSLTFGFPGHVRRYIFQYINEITVLLILHGYQALFWLGNTSISTCRPSTDRYVGRHIGRYSIDMLADCPSTDRSVCRSALGRHLGRYVDCRWCIGRLSVVLDYCSRLFSWNSGHLLPTEDAKKDYIAYSRVLTGQDAAQTAANSNTYLFTALLEGVRVCSRGIAVFAEQGTTFTRPQSAILQIAIDQGIDRDQNF